MKCQHCHKREATTHWLGEGSMMDFVHGNYERWCQNCANEAVKEHDLKELARLKAKYEESNL